MSGFYKYDEWTLIPGSDLTPDTNLYVDLSGKPITGTLENFYFYSKNDPRNNKYVKNGKPTYDEQDN